MFILVVVFFVEELYLVPRVYSISCKTERDHGNDVREALRRLALVANEDTPGKHAGRQQ